VGVQIRWPRLTWGLLFVAVGAVPLAVDAGLFSPEAAGSLWRLWPFALVSLGLALLGRGTPAGPLFRVVTALLVGSLVGGLLDAGAGGSLGSLACGEATDLTPFSTQSGELATLASVEIRFDCGDLTVAEGTAPGWTVSGRSSEGRTPLVDAAPGHVVLRTPEGGGFRPFVARHQWVVTLSPSPAMSLHVTANAATATVDLHGTSVEALDLTVNAGSARVDGNGSPLSTLRIVVNAGSAAVSLPDADLSGSITVNSGSLRLCAPPDLGLDLAASTDPTGVLDLARGGLVAIGSHWQSRDLATAAHRAILEIAAHVGRVELDRDGDCP
jgi:hypothetical protein